MRGILRSGVQRALDHLSNLRIRHCTWATCTIFVGQPLNAILHEPPPPFADRVLVDTEALGNFLALQSLCTQQNHPASIRERPRRFVPPDLGFEKRPVLATQYDQICLSTRHHQRSHLSDKSIYNDAYFSSR